MKDVKLYLVKKVSQKQGKEPFQYVQLVADLGYNQLIVSMDKNVIAEFLGVSVSSLYYAETDVRVYVGTFSIDKEF